MFVWKLWKGYIPIWYRNNHFKEWIAIFILHPSSDFKKNILQIIITVSRDEKIILKTNKQERILNSEPGTPTDLPQLCSVK